MFRHLIRQTVKFGEFRDYVAALKDFNRVASSVGIPEYKLWTSAFGELNEVWSEAEYPSIDAHVTAWDNASKNEEFMAAFRALGSHLNAGQDWPLMPMEL